jgi:MFS family permease
MQLPENRGQGRNALLQFIALQIIVTSGSALASLISMCPVPALPAMAAALGGGAKSALYAQIVMTAPAISYAVSAPLAAVVVPRVGLRSCLIGALLLYLISGVIPLFVDDIGLLVISRVLLGAGGGAIATITTMIAGDFLPDIRNRLLGFTHAAGGGAAIAALSCGGFLVDTFSWRAPFALYLAALPILLLVLYAVRENRRIVPARALRNRAPVSSLWVIYLIMFVMSVGYFTPGLEGPFLLTARGIGSARAQGLFLSVMPLVSVFVSAGYGWLARFLSERGLVFVTLATLGFGLAMTGGFAAPSIMFIGLALTGVGAGLAIPIVMSIIIGRTSDEIRLRAIGIYYTTIFLGQFLTPVFLEPIRERSDSAGVFLWVGAAISILGFLALGYFSSVRPSVHASSA